jgi:hypothetical protein
MFSNIKIDKQTYISLFTSSQYINPNSSEHAHAKRKSRALTRLVARLWRPGDRLPGEVGQAFFVGAPVRQLVVQSAAQTVV